ncbi:hypothetical protein [Alteromonas oceanisediminis]|uniref:hypothetical protein n=1 Tax=Alteromonas oceanisediminis TaxID=2836180 RepID=UPI001BD9E44E|nr:hypothetical protein [Alteromonas oceanisediminis]MBT0587002.1 hypothetical protein [Alteromonas oceanisediminis]
MIKDKKVKYMRKSLAVIAFTGIGLSLCSLQADAQFFDRLKEKASKAVTAVEEAESHVQSAEEKVSDSGLATKGEPSLEGGPADSLIAFTQCAGLPIENVVVGTPGNYEFQQGFSVEERSGFVDRIPSSVSNDCILPSIVSGQAIYMEVDEQKFEALGSANDWEMQCVRSDNPRAGALGQDEPKTEYPSRVNYLSPKDYHLHCGHNVAHAEECSEGSNSDRSSAWDKNLDERGKKMLSVFGNSSTLAPKIGEKLYCQYYNKRSRKSLFAFEYLRRR